MFCSLLSVQHLGNLSACSFPKRFKTTGLGEINLNTRFSPAFKKKKIQYLLVSLTHPFVVKTADGFLTRKCIAINPETNKSGEISVVAVHRLRRKIKKLSLWFLFISAITIYSNNREESAKKCMEKELSRIFTSVTMCVLEQIRSRARGVKENQSNRRNDSLPK